MWILKQYGLQDGEGLRTARRYACGRCEGDKRMRRYEGDIIIMREIWGDIPR